MKQYCNKVNRDFEKGPHQKIFLKKFLYLICRHLFCGEQGKKVTIE